MNRSLSNEEVEVKTLLPRFRILYIAVAASLFVLFCRLWYLQIIEGEELADFSKRNRIKEKKIPSPRGLILDRNEQILVENLQGFEATITPQYTSDLESAAEFVGKVLDIPPKKIISKVKSGRRKNGPFRPVRIKENLSRNEVFRLKLRRYNHPGLEIAETIVRSYPLNENGAQLFGYVGEISKKQLPVYNKGKRGRKRLRQGDIIGKSGLEQQLEENIRGIDGADFLQVDARGREATVSTLKMLEDLDRTLEVVPGKNVLLTIDKDVQKAAYKAFQKDDKIGPRIGALIAMKPNGEVIAWISSPSFDPNQFSTGISEQLWSQLRDDPYKPLRNKVVQDHAAPGSTLKAVVAIAALQEKVITKNTTHFCPGHMRFGRRLYHCHLRYGHGNVNVFQALERSCNIFFYKLGIALGVDRIAKYAKALGMGVPTNVDIPNEVPGLVPTTAWKLDRMGEAWQPGENLSNAIGQGFFLANPIQMAVVYSAIATEGRVVQPYLVKKLLDHQTHQPDPNFLAEGPKLLRDISTESESTTHIDKETFRIVKEGLRRVANGDRGTAKWWKIPGVEIAGKTGTGQLRSYSSDQIYSKCEERPLDQRHHGWFVGFAPADKPVITVAMLAEHSCHGSTGAAPIVRDVIRAYVEKYHPEMIKKPKPRVRRVTVNKEAAKPDPEKKVVKEDEASEANQSADTPAPSSPDSETGAGEEEEEEDL